MNINKAVLLFNEYTFLTGMVIKKPNTDMAFTITIMLAPEKEEDFIEELKYYRDSKPPFSNYSRLVEYNVYVINAMINPEFCKPLKQVIDEYLVLIRYEDYLKYIGSLLVKNEELLNTELDKMAIELTSSAGFFEKGLKDRVEEIRQIQVDLKYQAHQINRHIKDQGASLTDIIEVKLKEFPKA